jgi:hypothetical protein
VFATPYKLVCKWAEVKDFEELDKWRQHDVAVTLDGRDFVWTARRPANQQQSALATNEIHNLLEKAVQDSGDRFSDRFKRARLDSWSRLIDAKEQLEKRLEEPIPYTQIGRAGGEFNLQTTTPLTAAVLDQERLARPHDEPNSRGVEVTVVDVDGTDLTVRAARPAADLGTDGVLVRDRTPTGAAIRRQKNALSALREGSAARPHLRELVLDPSVALAPEPVAFQPLTPDLDDDKKIAVSKALGSGDLFLVEGPPGTGKTSFICELVNQYLAARPGDRFDPTGTYQGGGRTSTRPASAGDLRLRAAPDVRLGGLGCRRRVGRLDGVHDAGVLVPGVTGRTAHCRGVDPVDLVT